MYTKEQLQQAAINAGLSQDGKIPSKNYESSNASEFLNLFNKPIKREGVVSKEADTMPQINTTQKTVTKNNNVPGILLGQKGEQYDIKNYATDPNQKIVVQNNLKDITTNEAYKKSSDVATIDTYIQSKSPNSQLSGDQIVFAANKYDVDPYVLTSLLQHESLMGTSNVALKNNNFGGITWNENIPKLFPGATKGSPRPANEGGYYVKFNSIEEGLDANAKLLSNRKTNTAIAQEEIVENKADDSIVEPKIQTEEKKPFNIIEMIKNVPSSMANIIKDTFSVIVNPIDSAKGVINLITGVAAKAIDTLIPGDQRELLAKLSGGDKQVYAEALGEYVKGRYGSQENFLSTLEQDPAGVVDDLSMVFTGLKGISKLGGTKTAKITKVLNTIENVTDVQQQITKGMYKTARKVMDLTNINPKVEITKLTDIPVSKYKDAFKVSDNTILSKKLDKYAPEFLGSDYIGSIYTLTKKYISELKQADAKYAKLDSTGKMNVVAQDASLILDELNNIKNSYLDKSGAAKSGHQPFINEIDTIIKNLESDPSLTYKDLNDYKKDWSNSYFGKQGEKTKVFQNATEASAAQARLTAADAIDDFLEQRVPELAEVNKQYAMAQTMKGLLESTSGDIEKSLKASKNQAQFLIPYMIGAGVGAMGGTQVGKPISGTVLGLVGVGTLQFIKKLTQNTTFKTLGANGQSKVIENIMKFMDESEAAKFNDISANSKKINEVIQKLYAGQKLERTEKRVSDNTLEVKKDDIVGNLIRPEKTNFNQFR